MRTMKAHGSSLRADFETVLLPGRGDQARHHFRPPAPRERLIEDESSARFGASRHEIRSAFVELERIGLVTRRPNRGAVVRDFSSNT